MKDVLWGLLALVLLMVVVGDRRDHSKKVAALQAAFDRRDSVRVVDSVEVVRTVTKTRTLRDSVLLLKHDTSLVERFVYSTDTLRLACEACIASASGVSVAGKELVAAVKPSWKDRIGVTAGYGATITGSVIRVGPQVGVSIRIWP